METEPWIQLCEHLQRTVARLDEIEEKIDAIREMLKPSTDAARAADARRRAGIDRPPPPLRA